MIEVLKLLIIFYVIVSTFVFGLHAIDASDLTLEKRIVYTTFAPIVVIVLAAQLLFNLFKNKKEE